MSIYYFMLRRYQHHFEQFKCVIIFMSMILPSITITFFMRTFSEGLFHTLLFLNGWVTWTFIEYNLHRFHMHAKNSHSVLAERHQHHHTHPTELSVSGVQRIALIGLLLIICGIAFYLKNYFTAVAGICCGITGYFVMHKVLHQKIAQRLFKRLVRYHIYHHCKYPNSCYGISVPWWDDLFRTVPKNPKISQRIVEFYFNESTHQS